MSESTLAEIKRILDACGVPYHAAEHQSVTTSEEAAAVRGTKLEQGVKAMVIRVSLNGKKVFFVAALPANRRVSLEKIALRLKGELKLARPEEVLAATGCEVGGVPPLGHGLAVLFDPRIFEVETVDFNAGLKTQSIEMPSSGLRKAFESIGATEYDLAQD